MASEALGASDEKDAPSHRAFPILDLPTELRNNIYAKVIEEQPEAFLASRTRYNLACRSALPRVCRQIRREFLAVLFVSGDIETEVCDLNFGHLITFLNRLSETELKTLSTSEAQPEPRITVHLTFKDESTMRGWMTYRDHSGLSRWPNRIQHPTKKGANAQLSYVVKSWVNDTKKAWAYPLQTLQLAVPIMPAGRMKTELEKITAALVTGMQI